MPSKKVRAKSKKKVQSRQGKQEELIQELSAQEELSAEELAAAKKTAQKKVAEEIHMAQDLKTRLTMFRIWYLI